MYSKLITVISSIHVYAPKGMSKWEKHARKFYTELFVH